MHNILVCQDMLKHYKRKNQPARCTLKVDLNKAYDSLSWDFIQSLLEGLKFPIQYVKWIMECISSPSFSLTINGYTCGFFAGKRGLRHLSPLLFVLVMEYFTRIMKKMCKKEMFNFHYHCKQLGLTHLIFADDLMLFSKGEVKLVVMLVRSLKAFARASGLNASSEKSAIYYGNVKEEVQTRIFQMTKISKGEFPFRPKKYGGLGVQDCQVWNEAAIGKYVWQVVREDVLWIKWVHCIYIKDGNLWEYKAPGNASWVWKTICKMKEKFKAAYTRDQWKDGTKKYTIKEGYHWLKGQQVEVEWHRWARNRNMLSSVFQMSCKQHYMSRSYEVDRSEEISSGTLLHELEEMGQKV
ncbi:uncharacterized protein LOC104908350 [Beta vulgaris subsp. vulgaris]|uniref:uncharacterized protein LOC104908350 n=1 Tax=Beta vulgaris subsp. vulgaris TaxID=3555 RepID=UPI00254989A5|nr:uncharacterized protein LOC104908350 [Beta vulgaris subsp. vulgaris]